MYKHRPYPPPAQKANKENPQSASRRPFPLKVAASQCACAMVRMASKTLRVFVFKLSEQSISISSKFVQFTVGMYILSYLLKL